MNEAKTNSELWSAVTGIVQHYAAGFLTQDEALNATRRILKPSERGSEGPRCPLCASVDKRIKFDIKKGAETVVCEHSWHFEAPLASCPKCGSESEELKLCMGCYGDLRPGKHCVIECNHSWHYEPSSPASAKADEPLGTCSAKVYRPEDTHDIPHTKRDDCVNWKLRKCGDYFTYNGKQMAGFCQLEKGHSGLHYAEQAAHEPAQPKGTCDWSNDFHTKQECEAWHTQPNNDWQPLPPESVREEPPKKFALFNDGRQVTPTLEPENEPRTRRVGEEKWLIMDDETNKALALRIVLDGKRQVPVISRILHEALADYRYLACVPVGAAVPVSEGVTPTMPDCSNCRRPTAKCDPCIWCLRLRELTDVIRWMLGEIGTFPSQTHGAGPYWWRNELRKRARIDAAQSLSSGPKESQ